MIRPRIRAKFHVDPVLLRCTIDRAARSVPHRLGEIVSIAARWKRTVTALGALLAVSVLAEPASAATKVPMPPTLVSIGGGTPDSPAFRASSALAEILSRPPGLPSCDPGALCGVPGVIAGAQTYDQPDTLLKGVADGRITTGILSALKLYQSRCALAKGQPPAPIRALKGLYREAVQLVLPADSPVRTPKDLAGRPVAVGERGSDADFVAAALLEAYGVPKAKVKLLRQPDPLAALKERTAQAALLIRHGADPQLADLIGHGGYMLLSLPDSAERRRFLHALPVFEPDAIAPGTYPPLGAMSTVADRVLWVAGPALPGDLGERLVTAAMEPHNATRLAQLVEPLSLLPQGEAFLHLPVPLADGGAGAASAAALPVEEVACAGSGGP